MASGPHNLILFHQSGEGAVTSSFASVHDTICEAAMRLHPWLCLLLIELSACVAFSVGVGHSKVSKVADPPSHAVDKNRTLSERELLGIDGPERGTSTFRAVASEARSLTAWPYDVVYAVANKLNLEPELMFRLLRVANVDKNASKSTRFHKWFEYVAKNRLKKMDRLKKADRLNKTGRLKKTEWLTDSALYELLRGMPPRTLAKLLIKLRKQEKTQLLADNMLFYMHSYFDTRKELFNALLESKTSPQQFFTILNLQDLKSDLFCDWLKYSSMYRNLVIGDKDDIVAQQQFLYSLYDRMKPMRSTEELMEVLNEVKFPHMKAAKLADELKEIVEQEILLSTFQEMSRPPTISDFAAEVKLEVGLTSSFLQWLRYCQSYRNLGINGDRVIVNDELLQQMVLDVLIPKYSIDKLPSLFERIREAPNLQKFADKMVQPAKDAQLLDTWLKGGLEPSEVYEKLWGMGLRSDSLWAQWVRFVQFFEAKTTSIVSLKEINSKMSDQPIFTFSYADAVNFEPLKDMENIRGIATRLQREIFAKWEENNITPMEARSELLARNRFVDNREFFTAASFYFFIHSEW